ncbi:TonB-dependent receptor [Massilia sp. IC2-477]|uniref:TonB-dependent receptor domain-containing protein n=1 Tax=Massilia sp. IC2-477 TaxID=2887198 RepID=UPI001D116373|nr:TonB-dependent receptor [Massilia sp. IC2-477]MCC2958131.1 TonB-dependent receptor [Massilia sp. IC2-477]
MAIPRLSGTLCLLLFCGTLHAQTATLDIPAGDLKTALDQYATQTGVQLLYRADDVRGRTSAGAQGTMDAQRALDTLLAGTGLAVRRDGAGAVLVFREAQDGAPVPTADSELNTVTVTAQKRSQSAQAVPIAMTALSAKSIDAHRVQGLQDLARLTPGLLVSAFSQANPTIAIRGISNTFSQVGVNKPVGIFVDDVFIPRNSAASFELFDLESIAVLKGPQGTLFGRNVTGGAIVINTRQPDPGQYAAEAELIAGNRGERQARGLANLPLGEQAALKLSTSLRRRDGLGRDRLTGAEQDDIDSQNFRAQAFVRLVPAVDLTVSADYSDDRNGGRTLSSDTLGDDGDVRTSELGVTQRFARIISGASARLVWRLPAGELTSITAYRKSQSGEDYSGVGANYAFLASGSQSVTRDADQIATFSQELRYASPRWARGDVVAGLYYSDEEGERQLGTRGLAARTGALASATLAEQAVDSRSIAVFADGVVHLSPQFDLSLGARYTRDRKQASLVRTDLLRPTASFSVQGLSQAWSEFTPRMVLGWTPRPGLLGYLSATRGFTSGGYNADASSAAAFRTAFAPETVNNFELGLKSQWLQNRVRLNASLFRMKYRDKQELVNNTLTGILTIVNAGRASVNGSEMELAWKAASWLDLSASAAYLDSRYDRFAVGTVNNTGNRLSNSPRRQASVAANLSYPVSFGYLVGAASHAWKESYNTGAANDPNLQLPSYGLANLSAGIESLDRSWRLLAWVKNAGDTAYLLTRSTQVVRARYAGEPRTFGLSLTGRF